MRSRRRANSPGDPAPLPEAGEQSGGRRSGTGRMAVACSHGRRSAHIVRRDDWSCTEELCRMDRIQAGVPSFAGRLFVASKAVIAWQPQLACVAQGWVRGLSVGDPGYFGLRPGAAGSKGVGGTAVPELAWSYVRSGGPVRQKGPAATRTSRQGCGQVTPPGSRLSGGRARTKSRLGCAGHSTRGTNDANHDDSNVSPQIHTSASAAPHVGSKADHAA